MLKLNINKDTLIVSKEGKEFKGDLTNRKLAVIYGTSTRSIPAQTNPYKVVVLSDPLVPDNEGSSYCGEFTGTVTEIQKVDKNKDSLTFTLKNEEGLEAIFTITKDTHRINKEEISVGSVVTGYYDAKMFRIMIYPAQYQAEVVAVEPSEHNYKVDYFDKKLTSAEGTLTIKIGKNTELIYRDETKYKGKPVNSNLVVIYDKATKSIPAQTEPIKVIILEDSYGKGPKGDAEDKKDKDDKYDKQYWDKKLEEWKKLTKEIMEHYDVIIEDRDVIYDLIRQLFNSRVVFRFRK